MNDPVNSLDPYGLNPCVAVLQAANLHPAYIERVCGGTTLLATVRVHAERFDRRDARSALPWRQHRGLGYQTLRWMPGVGGGIASYEATSCIMET